MRHSETGLVDLFAPVHEQIEVDDARPPALLADPPQRALDVEEQVEELSGRERRLQDDRAVQELRLRDRADRLGLAQPRDGENLDPRDMLERAYRFAQRLLTLPEIRSQAHVRPDHTRERSTTRAAYSTGGSRTTSGFRTRTRARSTASNCPRMPSAIAPASPSSSKRSGPAKTSRTRAASSRTSTGSSRLSILERGLHT